MNQDEAGASARDYGFLMFLTLLNVMNLLIDNCLPVSRTGSCRIWALPTHSLACLPV